MYSATGTNLGMRAIRWDAGQTVATPLDDFGSIYTGLPNGGFGNLYYSQAAAVNVHGDIAGIARIKATPDATQWAGTVAVKWKAGGTAVQILAGPDTIRSDTVVAINERGMVLGSNGTSALRWSSDGYSSTLLGAPANLEGMQSAYGASMDNDGNVVGYGYFGSGGTRALRWDASSAVPHLLGNLGLRNGRTFSKASAINDSGFVVGQCQLITDPSVIDYNFRAALWQPDDSVVDLNTMIDTVHWTLTEAHSVSDTGFISGTGLYDPDSSGPTAAAVRHFTMLVPEAGTYGRGDANFDTLINFDDLLLLAQHYGETNTTQAVNVADFNLDGTTNFDDLLALSQHYAASSSFEADWTLAQSLVPEPAAVAGLAMLARTRRSRLSRVGCNSLHL